MTNITDAPTPAALGAIMEQEEAQSEGLLAMGNELAKAHRDKVDALVNSTRNSLSFLVPLVFGMLVVLIGLGAWVALIVYRDMIAPLRVQLIETHALMERQEKLASLGVLAAGVAHEIRNPLTAIKARLFTQQKRLPPGTPEAEDAVVINDEINRLERIVRDFLQFARPAAPKRVTVSAEVPLQQVCDLMRPQLEKREIDLSVATVARASISVDLQQIKQVLINLVQNAADSIGHHGRILLRARLEPGPTRSSRGRVILEVEDDGKGIPMEVQKRLFDPFFTTKESGTGLGLAIAARIVEKHEGLLEFQTQMNYGTTFGVVLPRSESDEQHG
jgi:signal transduction histidine kinase